MLFHPCFFVLGLFGSHPDEVRGGKPYDPTCVYEFREYCQNNTLLQQRDERAPPQTLDKLLNFLAFYAYHLIGAVVKQAIFKENLEATPKVNFWGFVTRSDVAFLILHLERWSKVWKLEMEDTEPKGKKTEPDMSRRGKVVGYIPMYDGKRNSGAAQKNRYLQLMRETKIFFGKAENAKKLNKYFWEHHQRFGDHKKDEEKKKRKEARLQRSYEASDARVKQVEEDMDFDFVGLLGMPLIGLAEFEQQGYQVL